MVSKEVYMNVKELRLANAGAKVRCLKHLPIVSVSQGRRLAVQCDCKDGRVYALPDTVRVPCRGWPVHPDLLESGESYCSHDIECLCEGRGWIPTTNGSVWWKLIPTAFPKAHLILSTCTDGNEFRHWSLRDSHTQLYECDEDALWLLLDWTQRALVAAGSK